ncbi:MAG: dipeptidase [Ilumatobacteraceae bacterium]
MIDGHNDLPWGLRKLCDGDFEVVDIAEYVPAVHTDIPRLRAGGVTGQFWSVYVPSTLAGAAAVEATLRQIDIVHRMIARYSDSFGLAVTADDVDRLRGDGRIASLIGMEGGHSIDGSLGVLRMMHRLGVRYMTLTHNDNVAWADSATDERVLGGLSSFGEEVVREMNRIGMLVDLSHVSTDVMRQSIVVSTSPVVFSHSSARELCDVSRNVPDDVLRTLTVNGGLCMVTFVPDFVSPECAGWMAESLRLVAQRGGNPRSSADVSALLRERMANESAPVATIADVVAHIEHVREVAGIDHVGIGGDYDGCAFMPAGLDDVSGYPRLLDALRARSWSGADLDQLCASNVLRVLRDAEAIAASTR